MIGGIAQSARARAKAAAARREPPGSAARGMEPEVPSLAAFAMGEPAAVSTVFAAPAIPEPEGDERVVDGVGEPAEDPAPVAEELPDEEPFAAARACAALGSTQEASVLFWTVTIPLQASAPEASSTRSST